TEEVEAVFLHWVLPAKLEAGKSPGAQSTPQLLLFIGLLTPQPACVGEGIHFRNSKRRNVGGKPMPMSGCLLSPALSSLGEERESDARQCCHPAKHHGDLAVTESSGGDESADTCAPRS